MVKQQPGSFPRSDVSLCKGAQDAQHVLGIWRWEPLGNEPCFPLIATFSKKIVLSVLIKKKKKEKINICVCMDIESNCSPHRVKGINKEVGE